MKKTVIAVLILLLTATLFITNTTAQEEARWMVYLVYFRPSDRPVRPNVDAEIDALIKKAQRFFADQLELHGFERKTFQFETDAHGNAVVHHVTGQFPNAHYVQNGGWKEEISEQIHVPPKSIIVRMLESEGSFTGAAGTGGGGNNGGSVDIDAWDWRLLAHELAHACGLQHDWRADANAKRIKTFTGDLMLTSFCAAEWLSVHPAFNPGQAVSTKFTTIEMLPPTLVSPPNTIRLRFEVTDPDGLHQAQLQIPDFLVYSGEYSRMLDCKRLSGVRGTVEFVTTQLTTVSLEVIDVRGHMSVASFPIDVPSLIPPAQVISIPDANLAAAVREALDLSPGEALTTHVMLGLFRLEARNRGITELTGLEHALNLTRLDLSGNPLTDLSALTDLTNLSYLKVSDVYVSDVSLFLSSLPPLKPISLPDPHLAAAVREELSLSSGTALTTHAMLGLSRLYAPNRDITELTGLEHALNLTWLDLGAEYIDGEGYVNSNAVTDFSPLEKLTSLRWLFLSSMSNLVDASVLANLTQLHRLWLLGTAVSDVSALANLTQLRTLCLSAPGVSDVSVLANLTQLEQLWLSDTAVSDVSALANLTQLRTLWLLGTAVSDVSALANLTQLEQLDLSDTAVSDVSALANLTRLEWLSLSGTAVSDISLLTTLTQLEGLNLEGCPLSYASLHTHIPALQAKGIEVDFDNVAHPALLKISGDRQAGEPGATLKNSLVVEAMDKHGKPMVGRTVRFSVLAGEGTLSAKTVQTDARGKAQVTYTLGWYPGVNKVKASSGGIESWVLFNAVATEAAPQLAADVNGDGIVNILDLTAVSGQFGTAGETVADVNDDGVVNIQDLVLVAGAFGQEAAAPSAHAVSLARLTAADVEAWLREARGYQLVRDQAIPNYRNGGISRPGGLSYSRGIAVLETLLANLMPKETALLANYPNPFNPETWIPYQLATPAEVTVTIYAANGAVVRTLALGHRRAGSYASRSRAAYWDGRNDIGERVASGVYFYTLSAGDFTATRKMLILK